MAKVDKRKTHITRIFGTNRSGDVLSDIWIDVERMENVKSATQTQGGFWQEVQRKLRWMDDPNGDDYAPDGNPTRDEVVIKVCDPNAGNVNDPDEWVEVRAIKSLKSHGGNSGDQDYKDRLINDEVTEARKVVVRKIVHYDTNIDDDATAAAASGQKVFVIDSDNYKKDLGTKDVDQYVEHAIITHLKQGTNNRSEDESAADADRFMQTKLLNQHLIDAGDNPTGGAGGLNPPYRLDPFQNIVNVNFSTYDNVAVCIVDDDPSQVWATRDGFNWSLVGGFEEINPGQHTDSNGFINSGGWRRDTTALRDTRVFMLGGTQITQHDIDGNPTIKDFTSTSKDGFAWSTAYGSLPSADDKSKLTGHSYSNETKGDRHTKEGPTVSRVVNGYVYRVAGGDVIRDFFDFTGDRINGIRIERCKNTAADEDDDSQPWETVLSNNALYLSFDQLQVLKGTARDAVPTIICNVRLPSDIGGKNTIISSTDGVKWTRTLTTRADSTGSAIILCTGKVKA